MYSSVQFWVHFSQEPHGRFRQTLFKWHRTSLDSRITTIQMDKAFESQRKHATKLNMLCSMNLVTFAFLWNLVFKKNKHRTGPICQKCPHYHDHTFLYTAWCHCSTVVWMYQICELRENLGGLVRELNLGPLAPEARIIPLDQRAFLIMACTITCFDIPDQYFNRCSHNLIYVSEVL